MNLTHLIVRTCTAAGVLVVIGGRSS